MISPPPTTSAQIPEEWIATVREILIREGRAIRANGPQIEIKSLHDNSWRPLMLFGSGTTFTSTEERDLVVRRLEGR